jgi:predicted SAM-dependent methyltransferase
MNTSDYIQYGCGMSAPDGWRNFDASPTLRFERLPVVGRLYTKNATRFPDSVEYGDIVKGLPVTARSCRGVYCSHVLEHLSLADFRTALRNTLKVLQPGRVFRLVLPDLAHSVHRYLNDASDEAAILFMQETALGSEQRHKGLKGMLAASLGNSEHLWMWDYKAMRRELAQTGFVAIRRAEFGDSSDPKFNEVEDRTRWDNCLGVECQSPISGN